MPAVGRYYCVFWGGNSPPRQAGRQANAAPPDCSASAADDRSEGVGWFGALELRFATIFEWNRIAESQITLAPAIDTVSSAPTRDGRFLCSGGGVVACSTAYAPAAVAVTFRQRCTYRGC